MANLPRLSLTAFFSNASVCKRRTDYKAVLIAVVLLASHLQMVGAQPSGLRIQFSSDGTTTTISQHGITWHFDRPARYGRFINGDYWVLGPVTVTSVDPQPTTVNGNAVHGSMINPEQGGSQGYDERGANYDESVRVSFPVTIDYDASLISSISRNTDDTSPHQARAILDHQSVLTVLMEEPPADAFRPWLPGDDKTIRYTGSDIRWDRLPNISTEGIDEPSDDSALYVSHGTQPQRTIESLRDRFERPWNMTGSGINWPSVIAYHNFGSDGYHQYVARTLASGAVAVASDLGEGTQAKTDLVINYIQVSLEYYAAQLHGLNHRYNWFFPTVFAGIMLDDDDIRNLYKDENYSRREYHGTTGHNRTKGFVYFGADQALFTSDILPILNVAEDVMLGATYTWEGEEEQDTFTGYYARTGRRAVFWNFGPGVEEVHPSEMGDLPSNAPWVYKRMHSVAIPGFTLAGWAFGVLDINDASIIGVHGDAYVAYARRWMYETEEIYLDSHILDHSSSPFSIHPVQTTRNAFINAMWEKHEEDIYQ